MIKFDLSTYKLNCYMKNRKLYITRDFKSELKQFLVVIILFFTGVGLFLNPEIFYIKSTAGPLLGIVFFILALLMTPQMFLKISFSKKHFRIYFQKFNYLDIEKFEIKKKIERNSSEIKLIVKMKNGKVKGLYCVRNLPECNLLVFEEFVCFLNQNYILNNKT